MGDNGMFVPVQLVDHNAYDQRSEIGMPENLMCVPSHVSCMGTGVVPADQISSTPPPPPLLPSTQRIGMAPTLLPPPPSVYSQMLAESFHKLQEEAIRESAMKANSRPQQQQLPPQPHVHYVMPRKKQGGQMPSSKEIVALSYAKICSLFHLRQIEAARELGISLSALKTACRALGIFKWPNNRNSDAANESKAKQDKNEKTRENKKPRTRQDRGGSGPPSPPSPPSLLEAIEIPEVWEASSSSSLPSAAEPASMEQPVEEQEDLLRLEDLKSLESEVGARRFSLRDNGSSTCLEQDGSPSQSFDLASCSGSGDLDKRSREGSMPILNSFSGEEEIENLSGDTKWMDWFVNHPLYRSP
ncbi:hypothetical protein GUITHDRAFT_109958 [Guillardia theta CCMP2712]|uniref:RWP-RK domain-containing protein n=1 Tax=Guillardia theta (strain CCMP2712) TaxID=905079 RepID=L1J7U7_GUITC|nr:hypothetical protein GUITHDRAFT_109958 [Guillardia theta CCMP2712]EKX44174.1 hypothetical protein GUITHDRAFT_109958 [Guillardia theta CCMP2712]|eukprot:XP_005831154.1 hypothetical protein GUITHDRAFT_109958 [Guillardia theta CCMP2712]